VHSLEELIVASVCDVSSAPVLALEAQNSPLDVHHNKIAGTRVHAWRSKRRVRFGVAGKLLTISKESQSYYHGS